MILALKHGPRSISLHGEGVGWPCCIAEPLGEVHLQSLFAKGCSHQLRRPQSTSYHCWASISVSLHSSEGS